MYPIYKGKPFQQPRRGTRPLFIETCLLRRRQTRCAPRLRILLFCRSKLPNAQFEMIGPKDMSYMYPVYPIICSICCVLDLFPLFFHWRAGNIATIAMGLWTFGALLIVTVNTIVWHGSIENRYPIWGDIATAWLAVYSFAVSCCAFCIQYRLWSIARTRRVFFTHKEKKRQNYVTYFICYGAPLIFKVVHYVNQGHRYDLYEDLGPHQTNYNTPVALATYFVFDQIVCIIATIFSFMTVICILKHRKEFNAVISSSVKINRSRYFQLLSLAAVTVSIHLPFTLWMYVNDIVGYPIHPWISWEDTHSNWMRIAYITRFMLSISPGEKVALSISYWTLPLCGILYFLLFGFGEEAMMQYNAVFDAIRRPFGALFRKVHLQHVNLRRTWLDVLLSRPGTSIDPTEKRKPQTALRRRHAQITSRGIANMPPKPMAGAPLIS